MLDPPQIPGYRVIRPIASGGMGSVFEIEKVATRRRFAAKLLHEHLALEAEYRARFEREVGALCSVRHPNVVNVFEWSLPAAGRGKPYLVMELLEGEGLDQVLVRRGALAPADAISIMLQILDGLGAAHAAGVTHRDLGPSNVFLVRHGEDKPLVKLLDFGLAGPVGGGETRANITQQGTVMGKPAYISPEMLLGRPADGRSDIFACGVLLFRMISGELPYREVESELLWLERYADRDTLRELPALRSRLPSIPESLDRVISRAMCRDPAFRYQTATQMQHELLLADADLAFSSDRGGDAFDSGSSVSWPPLPGPVPERAAAAASTVVTPPTPLPGPGASAPIGTPLPSLPGSPEWPVAAAPPRPQPTPLPATPSDRAAAPAPGGRPADRSASSVMVIAKQVREGSAVRNLRPSVIAAGGILAALGLAVVVLVVRGDESPPVREGPAAPAAPAAPAVAAPVAPVEPAQPPPVPVAPDAVASAPVRVEPAPSPAADAAVEAAAGAGAAQLVRITVLGAPPGCAATLGGTPMTGDPPEALVARSTLPVRLEIEAQGHRPYETGVVPLGELTIRVSMDREPGTAGEVDGGTGAGASDAGPSGGRNPGTRPGTGGHGSGHGTRPSGSQGVGPLPVEPPW